MGRRGREILGLDESFTESPRRRWLGPISPAPDRQVGTFPFTSPFPIAIAWDLTPSLAGPVRGPWRGRRLAGRVAGFARGGTATIITAASAAAPRVALAFAAPISRRRIELQMLAGMAIKILGLHIRNVEEPVASDGEIDEGGLNCRLEVDDFALVDVTRVTLVAGSFDVELLEGAILDDGDAAFLGLEHIDQHFFLHAGSFRDFRRRMGVGLRSLRIVSLSGPSGNGRARYRSLCSVRPVVKTRPKSPGEFHASLGLRSRGFQGRIVLRDEIHIGPSQHGSSIEEVAQGEHLEQFFRTDRTARGYDQSKTQGAIARQLGIEDLLSQVEAELAIGPAADEWPGLTSQERLQGGSRCSRRSSSTGMQYSTVRGWGGDAPGGERRPRGRSVRVVRRPLGGRAGRRDPWVGTAPGRQPRRVRLDSEPQCQGEGDLGPGVESLSCGHGDLRAAEQSLETSHEVVVTDQTKLAALGESQAHLVGFGQVLQVGL